MLTVNGLTHDTTVYNVTVKAEDVGGHLVATLTIEGVSGTTATFTNTYTLDPVSVIINGNKILQNKTLAADQFSFEIYETDDVYHALVNGYTDTVSNASSGAFSFELPQYTKAGTYRYVIKEIIPAAAQNNLLDGITYDDSVYHVTVTVTDDGNGKLIADVTVSGDGVNEFNNEYVPDTPQLGDESNTFILYTAMLLIVIGLAVLVFKKRKAE